ncbi:Protein N-acetyltransferase, RimJ/RimL family [Halogranum amylolyticum]|uniref:Protein N-acetyltransferase, RimJ/RimL family n=1 Tax=Halogranum amylolyticum TaxID=660520 RepID=A0A1H8T4K6_9EURY|nr:GNAT family protein [Halogranum amylolyticum]SEO85725.1 Protein N-acetyltransferase, RimJ/RimL family [Halogranum amylolyticum]
MPGATFLRGDRLTLRAIDRDDASFFERWHNDPRVRVPLGMDAPRNETQVEESFENWFESDESVNLLVCLADEDSGSDDPEPIGAVSAKQIQYTRPELSYWVAPDSQGQGYAAEALELLVGYVFETYAVNGLWAQAFEYNDASWELLESLGFSREGTMRGHRFVRGDYEDVVVYGLLREEWERRE